MIVLPKCWGCWGLPKILTQLDFADGLKSADRLQFLACLRRRYPAQQYWCRIEIKQAFIQIYPEVVQAWQIFTPPDFCWKISSPSENIPSSFTLGGEYNPSHCVLQSSDNLSLTKDPGLCARVYIYQDLPSSQGIQLGYIKPTGQESLVPAWTQIPKPSHSSPRHWDPATWVQIQTLHRHQAVEASPSQWNPPIGHPMDRNHSVLLGSGKWSKS